MIERVVRASFAKPVVPTIVALFGAAVGVVSFGDLRRDVFPDLAAPVFNVIIQNPTLGADDLERTVAIPLERELAGLPHVRRVRSASQLGVTQVTVEFDPDADYYRSRQFVAERAAQVRLPVGTEPPLISSLTGRLNEVLEVTIDSREGAADPMSLRDLAELEVRTRIAAVPGVALVERLGGYLRQFQVQLDPDRMRARGVTLEEVLHAAEGANRFGGGGFVLDGPTEKIVRIEGRVESVDDIARTVVAIRGATPILLSDVAEIREAPSTRRGIAHDLRGEIISIRVVKQFGADTTEVSRGVRRAVVELQETLPTGIDLRVVYDQAELIKDALNGVGRAVLLGAAFVILVIFGLLGNVRAALIVTLTLPLSVALAGVVLRPLGVGLNTMTLGGFAIACGLLVDATIIVVENIVHRLRIAPGERTRREVVVAAATEVARPIAFATLILIAVFVPLLMMSGIEGRMYGPLAWAVLAAVAAALLLALTVVPVVAGGFLRPPSAERPEDVFLLRLVKRAYVPLLGAAMRHAGLVRVVTLGLTVPAALLAFALGSEFMPKLDEGAFMLHTMAPPEASLDLVDRLNHRVEAILRAFPEVKEVIRRTGRSERTEDPMPHTMSDVLVILDKHRVANTEELEARIRKSLTKVPGMSTAIMTPLAMRIDEGLGGTPADIQVRFFGRDLDALARIAEEAEDLMRKIPGLVDVRAERQTALPQIRVRVNREALARVGLTAGDAVRRAQVGLVGAEASDVWVGERQHDLVVRLPEDRRADAQTLRGMILDGHDGTRIPLAQVADIEEVTGPGAIRRERGSRRIAVEAKVSGRDLGGAAIEVEAQLRAKLKLPAGVFFEVGGRVEAQDHAERSFVIAIAIAVVLVFILLYLALGSVLDTFVILATLPDAFVGGIIALYLAGETWNVSSLVGLLGLFAIAVQNGLVLVAQTRGLIAEGKTFDVAIREASIGRVRPKLMTAATAILGLLPLLVLKLDGTELERPLAIVMVGGLITSTAFTLLALPTFYMLAHRLRERLRR